MFFRSGLTIIRRHNVSIYIQKICKGKGYMRLWTCYRKFRQWPVTWIWSMQSYGHFNYDPIIIGQERVSYDHDFIWWQIPHQFRGCLVTTDLLNAYLRKQMHRKRRSYTQLSIDSLFSRCHTQGNAWVASLLYSASPILSLPCMGGCVIQTFWLTVKLFKFVANIGYTPNITLR